MKYDSWRKTRKVGYELWFINGHEGVSVTDSFIPGTDYYSVVTSIRSADKIREKKQPLSEKEIQVQRKRTKIDAETRTLIEFFNMGNYNKLPDVEK